MNRKHNVLVSIIALLILAVIFTWVLTTGKHTETPQNEQEMPKREIVVQTPVEEVKEPENEKYNARISFYCNCPTCCGKWYTPEAIGKAGIPLVEGVHVAATADIPLGSTVEVEGLGTYIVADRVSEHIYEKYGTTIDVFMGTDHEKAWNMGVMQKEIVVCAVAQ